MKKFTERSCAVPNRGKTAEPRRVLAAALAALMLAGVACSGSRTPENTPAPTGDAASPLPAETPTFAPITNAPVTDAPETEAPGYAPRIIPGVSSIVSRNGSPTTVYALADDGRLFAFDPWDDAPSVGSPILFEVESVYSAATNLENNQNYAFAIKTDGTLWAWGDNEYGQLGTGSTESADEPVQIMDGVDKVYHFCTQYALDSVFALKKDGSLWGWGRNFSGELGDGTQEMRPSPVKILDGVSELFPYNKEWPAGLNFNVYALKTDGTLWAWGSPMFSGEDYVQGKGSLPLRILDDVVSVHATDGDSYAIRSDDSLWMWGIGGDFTGTATDSGKLKMPYKLLGRVKTVVTRDDEEPRTAYAIDLDGVLWEIGTSYYNLGGERTFPDAPKKVMDGVVSAVTYDRATFALREDGTLWSWETKGMTAAEGETYGFGNGTAEGSAEPVQILDGVASFDVRMMMNREKYEWHYWLFGSAIKTDGSLYVWGFNEHNELGLGTNENVLAPVKLADNVREAHISDSSRFYITNSGELYYWDLYYPSIGEQPGQITPIKALDNVEHTDFTNVFITKDGALWYSYGNAPVYVVGEK